MSEDMNLADREGLTAKDDYLVKIGRLSAVGWVLFFITFFALIVQSLFLTIKDKELVATENGTVIGQVVFDESRVRSDDQVMADIKQLISHCTTVSRIRVWEDLSICLNHLDKPLADQRVLEYEQSSYAINIEKFGCKNTDINFDNANTTLSRKRLDYMAGAVVAGEIQCLDNPKQPTTQAFKIGMNVKLTARTDKSPLAIKVLEMWDVNE